MIRVVLDTNVIVSGFPPQSGTLRSVIERWRDQEYELQISALLLEQIERTWNKPYWRARFSHFDRSWVLGLLHRRAILVSLLKECRVWQPTQKMMPCSMRRSVVMRTISFPAISNS